MTWQDILSAVGSICSIVSILGLYFTFKQVKSMKAITQESINLLKTHDEIEKLLPLFNHCVNFSNENHVLIDRIMMDVRTASKDRDAIIDEIKNLYTRNEKLIAEIESALPKCKEDLLSANELLLQSIQKEGFYFPSIESAKRKMTFCHDRLLQAIRPINEKRQAVLVKGHVNN